MASYKVGIKSSAQKEIRKLPNKDIRGKAVNIIDDLENNPFPVGSKKIKGSTNIYRIRFGVYRVIYSVYENDLLILVIRVQHRKDIYRNL